MNYLAHAFLSFNNADILTGNMISDFVKGKAKFDYPGEIQKGIHLHRLIDSFTDSHEVTARAKKFFRPQYRLYSGAFVDIVYDHFLAIILLAICFSTSAQTANSAIPPLDKSPMDM
ncbi:MAG TPA: hypothetical protein VIL78_02790, partial [Hanamia sp.]